MKLLVLLLAVCTAKGDGVSSLNKVFEMMLARQTNHCDVRQYEAATDSLASCDTTPIGGLVPDDTFCDFTTGYMVKTTQYCGKGFWFTVPDHPHYGRERFKRENAAVSLIQMFNSISTNGTIDLPEGATTTIEPSSTPLSEGSMDGWSNCPLEPIPVTPNPGETTVNLTHYFEQPRMAEEGWTVTLSQATKYWLETGLNTSAVKYNGQTKTLSYVAENDESGSKVHCEVEFMFESKLCSISDIEEYANMSEAILFCDKNHWGIHGEKCEMKCKDMDKSPNMEGKKVYAECDVDEVGYTFWNWKAENKTGSGNSTETIMAPFCEQIGCSNENLELQSAEESSLLECYDEELDDYRQLDSLEIVPAGGDCRRRCMGRWGEVCSGMEYMESLFDAYNWYMCDRNGNWNADLDRQECDTVEVWKECAGPMPNVINHGTMCCMDDWCYVSCDDGFMAREGSPVNVDCRQDENGTYTWQTYKLKASGEWDWVVLQDFPGDICKASCGAVPYDLTDLETDSITPDCSDVEVGGMCTFQCSEYSYLMGSVFAMCEFNNGSKSAEWRIPDMSDEPRCDAFPCDDMISPENGTTSCVHDPLDGTKVCDVNCNEGFTHSLKYNTRFTCDEYGTGRWPDDSEIPSCVEANRPVVKLTFKAMLEADYTQCYQINDSLDVSGLQDDVIASCPTDCTCIPEDFKSDSQDSTFCLVQLPVVLDCVSSDGIVEDFARQISTMWSLISSPASIDDNVELTDYPSVADFETTCPTGSYFHEPTESCIQCTAGFIYNPDTTSCEACESGNAVDGSCVDYEAPQKYTYCLPYDRMRQAEVTFTNCSTQLTSDGYVADTYCKVECADQYQHHSGVSFVYCKNDGTWKYTDDTFYCEAYECLMGQYSKMGTGTEPCAECKMGYYSNETGSVECFKCPDGLTTAYTMSISISDCVATDEITFCPYGHYVDGSNGCAICPFSAYCDGSNMLLCPDQKVTASEGSGYEEECVSESWTIEEMDPDERTLTINNLEGIENIALMEYRIRQFSPDLIVELSVPPYTLQIGGDGNYAFSNAGVAICEGTDFFAYAKAEWTNVTLSIMDGYFKLKYGGPTKECYPPGGELSPVEEGLTIMIISLKLKAGAAGSLSDVPRDSMPFFAYLALYTDDNIYYNPQVYGSGGYDYGSFDWPDFGSPYYSDSYPSGFSGGYGPYPSGSGGYGPYPSGTGGYGPYPSGTGDYGPYPSGTGDYGPYPSGTGDFGPYPSGTGGYGPYPSGTGDYGPYPSGTGDYGPYPSGTGDYGPYPSGTGDYGPYPSGTSDYGPFPSGTGDYGPYPSGTGDYGPYPSGTGDYGPYPSGTGDYGPYPSGTGDYGPYPSGTGDYGPYPSGTGDYGPYPSGTGDYGPYPSGTGDYGPYPSGTGDYGPYPSGTGDYGPYPSGTGDYGPYPSGTGDYGPDGSDPYGSFPSDFSFRRKKRQVSGATSSSPTTGADPSTTADMTSTTSTPTTTVTTTSSTTEYYSSSSGSYPGSPPNYGSGPYPDSGYPSDYGSGPYPDSGYPSDFGSGPYPGTGYPSDYGSGPYSGSGYPSDYGSGPYPGTGYPSDYGSGPYPGSGYPSDYGSGPYPGTGYPPYYGSGPYPGTGYPSDYGSYPYGTWSDNGADDPGYVPLDCFKNLMNFAEFSDRDHADKPYSCRSTECKSENYNPDRWTCRPCGFGEYKNNLYGNGSCESCPVYSVTRTNGTNDTTDCYYDSWSIKDYDRVAQSDAGPSAVITGLQISSYGALSFYLHIPEMRLTFELNFAQYTVQVNADLSFNMFLDGTKIMDGSSDDFFAETTGSGWVKTLITFDDETQQVVLQYGKMEKRSANLVAFGFSREQIDLPLNEDLPFTIDVFSESEANLEGAEIYIAYVQVFEDRRIDECLSNKFAFATNYVNGPGVETKQPYSCPDVATHWTCADPGDIFGHNLNFACTDSSALYSECTLSCMSGYQHGPMQIKCMGTHWEFDIHKLGVPGCNDSMPAETTCPEPSLPSNVLWMEFSPGEFAPICSTADLEFQWGYNNTATYMCDTDTLEWTPSPTLIPKCFRPTTQKTAWNASYQIYNPQKLSCDDVRDMFTELIESREVKGNSPSTWDASPGISKLDCGALEGTYMETSSTSDPVITSLRQQRNCADCDIDCFQGMWSDMENYLKLSVENNMASIFLKMEQLQTSYDKQTVADEIYNIADSSNNVIFDSGVSETAEDVKEQIDKCTDYTSQTGFEMLSESIDETIADLTNSVEENIAKIDSTVQMFGAVSSGIIINVDIKIATNLSDADKYVLQQVKDMEQTFFQRLVDAGKTIYNNDYSTDTSVECGEGKEIAAKGLCETVRCGDEETRNATGGCEKCDKFTSIIDEMGQCVPCPTGARVQEKKDGSKACSEPCPAGTYSATFEGYANPDTGACTPCPPGEYNDEEAQVECKGCPGIQTNFESESTSCTLDYDVQLTNKDGNGITLHNLNQDKAIPGMTFSVMAKKYKENEITFHLEFGDLEVDLKGSNVTLCCPQCVRFPFDKNAADFTEYTQFAFTTDNGEGKVFIDGQELTPNGSSNIGTCHIPSESAFSVSGAAKITNFWLSDGIEDNLEELAKTEGTNNDKNRFRMESVQADAFDESDAKTQTSGYTGQPKDYCANSPCQNGGSCSRGLGEFSCLCQDGYSGVKCETEFEELEAQWSEWRQGACSVTCGNGTQTNQRTCIGDGCVGESSETVTCNNDPCKECSQLEYDSAKVNMTTTTEGSITINTFSCPGKKKFAKTGGANGQLPDTTFECGPETDYEWSPKPVTPQCITPKVPTGFKKTTEISFVDPAAVAAISCEEQALLDFIDSLIENIAMFVKCMMTSVDNLYPCSLTRSDVTVTKCSSRKKRAASGGDVILSFSLALSDQAQIDLQDMYDNNIVSPELLEVVQAIADLEDVGNNIQTLTATINGVNYTVDPSSVTSSSASTCQTGYYADNADCVPCSVGTYQDTTSGFCVLCPKGEYQDEEAQTMCKTCDDEKTTLQTGSTSSSYCIDTSSTDDGEDSDGHDDSEGSNGTIIGIAVGAAVGGLVLIGVVSVLIFKVYAASQASSANMAHQNMIYPRPKDPKSFKVPDKKKLYNEIENPHFVPPPKAVQPEYSHPRGITDEPPPSYLSVGQPDARAVTPPGTVMGETV